MDHVPTTARATKGSYWIDKDHPTREPIQVYKSRGYEVSCYRCPFSQDPSPFVSYRAKDLKLYFRVATKEEIAWAVMQFS